jgi:hypothetical protein
MLATAVLLGCVGCAAYGTKVSEDQLTHFTRGQTTYAEVVQALGPPNQSTLHSDGTRNITYTYLQSQVRAANYIPIVGAFVQGADTEQTNVVLDFDARSILVSYTSTQGQLGMGTGFASGARQ